jgi:hypothetical protein
LITYEGNESFVLAQRKQKKCFLKTKKIKLYGLKSLSR